MCQGNVVKAPVSLGKMDIRTRSGEFYLRKVSLNSLAARQDLAESSGVTGIVVPHPPGAEGKNPLAEDQTRRLYGLAKRARE